MKKRLSVLFSILLLGIGYAQDFTVNSYSAEITIHEKGYFDVVEKYDLNFEIQKHGIYRTIQTRYDLLNSLGQQEKRKIRISRIRVPGYKFEAPFAFVQKMNDQLEIKIGDPDVTLIGPQHYEIRYRVHQAFLFEEDMIRFYWNIKPDGWQVNFHKINFTIHVPEGIALGSDTCFVYAGPGGTTEPSPDFELGFGSDVLTAHSKDGFLSRPGESVTVLINLPLNTIAEEKPFWPFWTYYGWLFIVGALLVTFYLVWRKYGKDDRVISVTSYYPPENIDPAMAGFLMNDRSDASDLIALIPYWGTHGNIKVEEVAKKGWFGKKDTRLVQLKPLPSSAPNYAHKIFNGLFGTVPAMAHSVQPLAEDSKTLSSEDQPPESSTKPKPPEVLVSSLKDSFYKTMDSAKGLLKKQAQPYYVAESRKVQRIMTFLLLLAGLLGTLSGLFFWGPLAAVAVAIASVLLLVLNFYMVKRNAIGNKLLSELKGFKRFIKVAEENKLRMLLAEDPGYFENTMGYALAFGLFDKWAKKFAALKVPPPKWYSGTSSAGYNMRSFSKSFSSTMSGVKSTMVSTPSKSGGSSGGGSSGGGFGGGGGGSW